MDKKNFSKANADRQQELKTSTTKTSSGETSSSADKKDNIEQNGKGLDGQRTSQVQADVETLEPNDRNSGASVGDNRDSRNH